MSEQVYALSRLARLDVKWARCHHSSYTLDDQVHYNPFNELLVVFEGPVYLQVEQEKLELQSGDCYLLLPWETHCRWKSTSANAGFFWAQFSASPSLRPMTHEIKLDDDIKIRQLHQQDLRTIEMDDHDPLWIPRRFRLLRRFETLSLFEKLLDMQKRPHGYFRFYSTLLLGQILGSIADQFLEDSRSDATIPASFNTYRKIVTYLDEFYRNAINRETLESTFHHKYEYLCQLFKKYAGIPMVAYIRHLRVQRAKYLLGSSSHSIADIAGQVGFSDPYYFSKVFKSIEGLSPNEFRKSQHGNGRE